MKPTRLVVVWVVAMLLVSACGTGGSPDTSAAATSLATSIPDTSVDQSVPTTYDGPCMGADGSLVVDAKVTISGQRASFAYASYSYCPDAGVDRAGIAEDGFLADIDDVRVDAEPAGSLVVDAPGYPGASLTGGWTIRLTDESETAVVVDRGGGRWEVEVPDRAATYVLHLRLLWSTGDAAYGATVIVGDEAADAGLVPIAPDHHVDIHPTLLPGNLVACDPGEADLKFCDPDTDYVWIAVSVKPADAVDPSRLEPDEWFVPGAMRIGGAGTDLFGIFTAAHELLTVGSSGIEFETMIDVTRSIPAFDSDIRSAVCAELDVVDFGDFVWMCDLAVSVSGDEMVEAELREFVRIVGDAPVVYQFRPVLPGTLMTDWRLISPWETLDEEIAAWREAMVRASEEMGYDPSLADPGSYWIRDLLVQPQPTFSLEEWATLIAELETAGFALEPKLREARWHEGR